MYHPHYPYDPNDDRQPDEKFIDDIKNATTATDDAILIERFSILVETCLEHFPEQQLMVCQLAMGRASIKKRNYLMDTIFRRVELLRDDPTHSAATPDFMARCNNIFMDYEGSDKDRHKQAVEHNRTLFPHLVDPTLRLRTVSLMLHDSHLFDVINGKHDRATGEWRGFEHAWADLFANDNINLHERTNSAMLLVRPYAVKNSAVAPHYPTIIEKFLNHNFNDIHTMWKQDAAHNPPTKSTLTSRRNMWVNLATQLPESHPRKHHWVCHATQILGHQLQHETSQIQHNVIDSVFQHAKQNGGDNKLRYIPDTVRTIFNFVDLHRARTTYRNHISPSNFLNKHDRERYEFALKFYPKKIHELGYRCALNFMIDNFNNGYPTPKGNTDKHYMLILDTISPAFEPDLSIDALIETYNDVQKRTKNNMYVSLWAANRVGALTLQHGATTLAMDKSSHEKPDARLIPTRRARYSKMSQSYFNIN